MSLCHLFRNRHQTLCCFTDPRHCLEDVNVRIKGKSLCFSEDCLTSLESVPSETADQDHFSATGRDSPCWSCHLLKCLPVLRTAQRRWHVHRHQPSCSIGRTGLNNRFALLPWNRHVSDRGMPFHVRPLGGRSLALLPLALCFADHAAQLHKAHIPSKNCTTLHNVYATCHWYTVSKPYVALLAVCLVDKHARDTLKCSALLVATCV